MRRDRRGRGIRGRLAPPEVPVSQSRAQRFDELVLEAVEQLDAQWRQRLAKVEFAVEDVPSLDDWEHNWVPMARAFAASGALPARIVVYRRPIETRVLGDDDLRTLITTVVAEQAAELLGIDPGDVES